jgi:hypothetical protein
MGNNPGVDSGLTFAQSCEIVAGLQLNVSHPV